MKLVIVNDAGEILGTVIGEIDGFDLRSKDGREELAEHVRMTLNEIEQKAKA